MYTVLLTDDNKIYREIMMKLLKCAGYTVIPAENGAAALSLLQQNKPDIILSNGEMPIMTGIELLQAVKADKQLKTIPFVIITGHIEESVATVARNLGVDAIISKPFVTDELLSLLHRLLEE